MNSKAVQLLITLGLVTTLGACGGGDTTAPTDSAPAGDATEEPKEAEPKEADKDDEGGEGGES